MKIQRYICQQSERTGTAVLHTCFKYASHTFWLTLCDQSHRSSHFSWCPTDVNHLKLIWSSASVVMFCRSKIVCCFSSRTDWAKWWNIGREKAHSISEQVQHKLVFIFCRISWVVVWLCICGEDSNTVPNVDRTWQGSFLVLKSHFLFWIRVRRLLNWCPTILFSWENKSVNNVKTHTQHTNWSSCETKLNVVWLIINRHILSGAKKLKRWTKLNTHSRYVLIHTTQPNLLRCYAAAMSGRGQGTPEGVLYSALTRSFGS